MQLLADKASSEFFFLKPFIFFLETLILRNGASLLRVDKLTLENSTDSGKSRGPNFKWVCRQKAVEWLTLYFLGFFHESFYFFSRDSDFGKWYDAFGS